jgi:translation initiation factor 2B subunit (eIF-2B alpha/beta/delta family)
MGGSLKLSKQTRRRLDIIRGHVESLWKQHSGPPWYTFHDVSHTRKVEEMLFYLIPESRRGLLSEEEWFYLLASTWLHDVGMILNLFGPKENFRQVRDEHHERSARYIEAHRASLGLDSFEGAKVSEICRYHRKRYDINECEPEVGNVRLRLLAAYLRLADALHTDKTRIDEAQFRLLLATGMPWESRFHWLKSRWVDCIRLDRDELRILVSLFDLPKEAPRRGLLPRLVEAEIREELDSVRDVLIRGGISYFLDVQTRIINLPLPQSEVIELDLVLSNLELESISSASEAADSIIGTVLRLADVGAEAYGAIRDYLEQLQSVLESRPCHNLVQYLYDKLKSMTADDLPEQKRAEQVELIRDTLRSFQKTRSEHIGQLAQHARPFLSDGGSILLFGYSMIVLAALESLPDDIKCRTTIYVAECRGKTQYDHANRFIYCDGLTYAIAVTRAGFTDVRLIPDVCVANFMARKPKGLFDKVVFGANGIDPKGHFGHTAGHLALADLANRYNVPVYVLADTAKIRELAHNDSLERDTDWLTRDSKSLGLLAQHGIKLMNPREDTVGPDRVTKLITEDGAFDPTELSRML